MKRIFLFTVLTVVALSAMAASASIYLQGIPVENPTSGLYIHNGKKIFIRP